MVERVRVRFAFSDTVLLTKSIRQNDRDHLQHGHPDAPIWCGVIEQGSATPLVKM